MIKIIQWWSHVKFKPLFWLNEEPDREKIYKESTMPPIEGFFITAAELEQREREAFDAGRAGNNDGDSYLVDLIEYDYSDANDYLKQRNREQALSELVADGEKNGDYDDQASQ